MGNDQEVRDASGRVLKFMRKATALIRCNNRVYKTTVYYMQSLAVPMILGLDVQYDLDMVVRMRGPTGQGVGLYQEKREWTPQTEFVLSPAKVAAIVPSCYILAGQVNPHF